jgi:hypothetical protein
MNLNRMSLAVPILMSLVTVGCLINTSSSCSFMGITGSGVMKTETREVPDFKRISTAGSINVDATVGSPKSVAVTVDDNLMQYVTTEVVDGTLKVGMKSGNYSPSKGFKVTVTTAELEKVSIAGSSDVDVKGLKGSEFAAHISGSGDIHATGHVDKLDASISGSGDLKLADLESRDAKIKISGSGDARVNATETLDVHIAGSGDVRYRGQPKVTRSIAGSGNVSKE